MHMQVLRIHAQDAYPLREKLFTPKGGQSQVDLSKFNKDMDDKTFHLGAFIDQVLVSVASFYFSKHPDISSPYQYQIRGLATFPDYRNKGVASTLVKTAYPIITQNQASLLWCSSRIDSVSFFINLGFRPIGGPFEIIEVGQQQLMYKSLQ
ncbi:MAG: GNAT family N-acetyltransferase [Oligoflexia bacterium]|nr:GNAT family N-acetyltransferase [Oligoflexia bacterium]